MFPENNEVWMWGYGKACGRRKWDVLYPEKVSLTRANAIVVAGGQMHSMALTGRTTNL